MSATSELHEISFSSELFLYAVIISVVAFAVYWKWIKK
jgi:NADH:ubiquinone oxidoreductase subunit K